MLLLTISEWLGPGRDHPNSKSVDERIRTISFATNLGLEEAINLLADYEDKYNRRYTLSINFTLLSVSTVDNISDGALELMRVQLIENMKVADK